VLLAGPTAATTEVEEDIDGGPHGGVLPMDPTMATIESVEDVGGGAPAGVSIPSYVQTHFCSYKVKHGK
jgi:hypothetical protein